MRLAIGKNYLFATLAFLYWFLENGKYGIALLFFANNPSFLFVVTAASSIGIFILTVVFCLKLTMTGSLKPNETPVPREVKLLWVFMAVAGVSLLWTNMLEFNFKIWVNILLSVTTFYLLTRYGDAQETAENTVKGFVYGAIFTAAVTLIIHPVETESIHRLGLFGLIDATRLGRMMGMTTLFILYNLFTATTRKMKLKQAGLLAITLVTLVFSFAKISLASTFITALMMMMMFRLPVKWKVIILSVSLLLGTLFVAASWNRLMTYTQQMGGNALSTVSGRTTYWKVSWAMIKANPLLGYGAGARLDLDAIPLEEEINIKSVKATQTHNEWMNMWFQYGVVGLFLSVLIYGLLVSRSIKGYGHGERELTVMCLSVLALTFLRSPFESDLVGFIIPEPFLVIFPFWLKAKLMEHQKEKVLTASSIIHYPLQVDNQKNEIDYSTAIAG